MARKTESVVETPAPEAPLTQRAYTLRLRGADPQDNSWRDALWATHEAVNKGAKVFGDWLLTLRGGLSHELVNQKIGKGANKTERDPTDDERRNRRILLTLSWLSVEDERGAPEGDLRVAGGRESDSDRREKVLEAFKNILESRRITGDEAKLWIDNCTASLSSAIREDAVWVNRSAVFDAKAAEFKDLTREYATETVLSFFGPADDYFALPDAEAEDGVAPAAGDDDSKFKQKARQWISTNFGTGEKSDTDQIIKSLRKLAKANLGQYAHHPKAELIEAMSREVNGPTPDLDGLRVGIGWSTGRPSIGRRAVENLPDLPTKTDIEAMRQRFAEEADDKEANSGTRDVPKWMPDFRDFVDAIIEMPFVGSRNHIGEFSVMLDHAARRVSIAHSWIKRAEAERRRLEADAQRLSKVPAKAAACLDVYVQKRSGSAGGEYRIRRRAIEAWDEVLKRWSRADCKTADDRIAAAREVQADPEIEKFGDIQLFEALASDDALCVWRNGNNVAPDRLKDYVFAHDARFKQRRFKVPAYRHPDALRHPVFCDFGNSRWDIRFCVHQGEKAQRNGKRVDAECLGDARALRMVLWTGQSVEKVRMRWACKRLVADLGLDTLGANDATAVTRADRLGRAAAGADGNATVLNVFDEKDWNGRLQAPRAELDRIARLEAKEKSVQAETLKRRLRWLVSFSPRLRPTGPFIDYTTKFTDDAPARPFVSRKGEYAIKHESNVKRQGHAKLILSRLPGLRVLSVDLGHRFAAACAVWETMSAATFMQAIAGGVVVAGGSGPNDLYCHVRTKGSNGRERTTIFRRVGSDTLGDNPHPAPWARLDRQFLIKLQGEDETPRKMSPEELSMLDRWRKALGAAELPAVRKPRNVAEGMADGARLLMLAIRRHADRARIAHNLTATTRTRPGGQPETLDHAGRVQLVAETLALWHGLFSGERWSDGLARALWAETQLPDLAAPVRSGGEEGGPAFGGAARRKAQESFINELRPHAERIVSDESLANRLSERWADRWEQDDRVLEHRGHRSGLLRELRRWVAPRGLRNNPQAARAARHVGGLSVGRINTLTATYRLLKAFKNRPVPADLRKNVPAKGDDRLARFHQRLLDMRDRLRDQRVKQLASRIVEAALGIGRMPSEHIAAGVARPTARVDAPCHAVVIESLTSYRPDELQTRRENRQLMDWSSAKVQKYLKEGCQLHGLHLREVMPNYTSRQCSRTGLPGLRCDDVPIDEFLTAPWWNKAVNAAAKRLQENGSDSLDRLLVALREKWSKASDSDKRGQRTLRLPRAGGDLFVAAPPSGDATKGRHRGALQADLNAAANIGLRALLDPDFPGRWWYVPCIEDKAARTAVPRTDKVKGSVCFGPEPSDGDSSDGQARPAPRQRTRRATADGRETTNFWSDPRAAPLRNGENGGSWLPTPAYWRCVRKRVVAALWQANGLGAPPADLVRDGQP